MNHRRITSVLAILSLAFALVGVGGAWAPAAHAQDDTAGHIRVVHGLRGLVADIYLDGTLVLPTFQPERSTDPLAIPAGDHLIEIRAAGAAITDAALLTQTVTVPARFQGSLVAHLDQSGAPTLTAFADDLTPVPAGTSRVVVRHVAAAEDINVLLNDQPALTDVAPAKEASAVVPSGAYEVAVTALAGGAPLAPPQNVEFPDGTANFMYLIGSEADHTLGWAAVQVGNLATAPTRIQTGDGSTEQSPADNRGILVLLAALAALAVVTGSFLYRSRSRRFVG
jgi:Domain of unknown function (DUF4397)